MNQKSGRFEPEKFEDQYETALIDLINQKRAGRPITPKEKPAANNVVDLMETLRRSVGQDRASKPAPKKPKRAAAGQKRCCCRLPARSRPRKQVQKKPLPNPSASRHKKDSAQQQLGPRGQPRGRTCLKWKPFGVNLLATVHTSRSHVSSAIFWASITSPIGRAPIGMKHSPSCRQPLSSISHTFTEAPA